MDENDWSNRIIGAAIEVHRSLGPGLLESVYEECLAYEFIQREIPFERQKAIPIQYHGVSLDCGFRLDLLVDRLVVVELKAVEKVLPIHEAQLITYLKLTGLKLGLIFNFNVEILTRGGVIRKVNKL